MNEDKFRGKAKDGRWIEGVPIKNGFGKLAFMCFATSDFFSCPMEKIQNFCIEVIPETVTKYTKINGKDNGEIYDGDIIKLRERTINGNEFNHICRVYQKGNGMWMAEGHPEHNRSYRTRLPLFPYRHKAEVIGNVYDNPELLEVCR